MARCDEYFDCKVCCPLAKWTKPQVFAFLKEHGEEPNPLYKLGFGRVGCAPCINSGKDDILLWATRFPEMIDKVCRWEREVGRTFFAPCVPGMDINRVDDVVRWAATARGGRQERRHKSHYRHANVAHASSSAPAGPPEGGHDR